MILIREETKSNPRKDVSLYNPQQIYEIAKNNTKTAYHEIITGNQKVRLYFDYDSKTRAFPVAQFENALQ
jgi:hypothetical protein